MHESRLTSSNLKTDPDKYAASRARFRPGMIPGGGVVALVRILSSWHWRHLAPALTGFAVLAIWHIITVAGWVDSYLLPPPADVFDKFQVVLENGTLWMHIRATMFEALLGLGAGVGIGMALGYLIARIALLEDLLSPVIVAFQSTPVVAYAPLLVIWFGSGAESKIITSALVVFFPMLMNTLVGVRNVPGNLRDLMRVSGASYWQTLTRLEIPAAMPVLLTGLKTSASLAMIGAVVGEFIVARKGLGFMVNQGRFNFDTPQVYVAVITMALITSAMYALLTLIERRMLRWQRRGR